MRTDTGNAPAKFLLHLVRRPYRRRACLVAVGRGGAKVVANARAPMQLDAAAFTAILTEAIGAGDYADFFSSVRSHAHSVCQEGTIMRPRQCRSWGSRRVVSGEQVGYCVLGRSLPGSAATYRAHGSPDCANANAPVRSISVSGNRRLLP